MSNERNAYQLAQLADVTSPDSPESPGAHFLNQIESAFIEDREYNDGAVRDDYSEMADNAVPIYTHQRWQVFVDLCAYGEDLDDLGGTTGDMTQDAGVALYMIAERLFCALAEEASEKDEEES